MNEVISIVNAYQNTKKPINLIMEENNFSQFKVILAICEYVFRRFLRLFLGAI